MIDLLRRLFDAARLAREVTQLEAENERLNQARRVRYSREASYVERVHTRPKLGSYNNGQHTYNMLAMLLILDPSPSLPLIKHIAFHDTGERTMGDVPYSAKKRHEIFGEGYEHAEGLELERRGFDLPRLNREEERWFKALDLVEFYFWALDQRLLGSQVFAPDIASCEDMIATGDLPRPIRAMVEAYTWNLKKEGWSDEA